MNERCMDTCVDVLIQTSAYLKDMLFLAKLLCAISKSIEDKRCFLYCLLSIYYNDTDVGISNSQLC